jgi:ATP-dependent DNA helicase PIF1
MSSIPADLEQYINYISQNKNIFLNSPGGCGKSYILKYVYNYMKTNSPHIKIALTSSTGISAVNIGGVTLHHYTGIGLGKANVQTIVNYIKKDKRIVNRWRNVDYIFLDEISMLGGSLIDKLNQIGQVIRGNSQPFGGIKFFISGDNLQLPPIDDYWFFQTDIWEQMEFIIIRNFTPYRYPDIKWFNMLMRIRVGKPKKRDIKKLKSRIIESDDQVSNVTKLFPKNKDVFYENAMKLSQLTSSIQSFQCFDVVYIKDVLGKAMIPIDLNNNPKYQAYTKMMDDAVPQVLDLKIGAECILTYNIDVANGLANGVKCTIIEIIQPNNDLKKTNLLLFAESGGVNVKVNDQIHFVSCVKFSLEDDEIIYNRLQVPLKVAYAFSVHKVQGLSLSSVCTSIGSDIFCSGQAYVALSRCKRLEDLYLYDFDPKKILVDSDAMKFEQMVSSSQLLDDDSEITNDLED